MNDDGKLKQPGQEPVVRAQTKEQAWKHPITGRMVRLLLQEVRRVAGEVAWIVARSPVEEKRQVDSVCILQVGKWMQGRHNLKPEKLVLYAATDDNRFQQVHFRSLGWSPYTERTDGKASAPTTHGVYRKEKVALEFSEVRRSHAMSPQQLEAALGCKLHPRFTQELKRQRPAPPLNESELQMDKRERLLNKARHKL